jgi:hypothetical protein
MQHYTKHNLSQLRFLKCIQDQKDMYVIENDFKRCNNRSLLLISVSTPEFHSVTTTLLQIKIINYKLEIYLM